MKCAFHIEVYSIIKPLMYETRNKAVKTKVNNADDAHSITM